MNCIIVRALHSLLHPGKDLHFAGFDQKPLWFNSIMAEKTFSVKGRKKVSVAENVSAARARFTAMTQTRTWSDGSPPAIAVLFKIGDAACSLGNLRAILDRPPHTLIQGAPKGSYRLTQVLEFLEWALPTSSVLGFIVVVVLDWFAAHLDKAVDELVHSLGHVVLRIGGGLTPAVQVNDTHAHRPYNNHYRNLEKDAATTAT